jgi:predicted O-linked N-acetylglucosamine transferase (SPINDLY family)
MKLCDWDRRTRFVADVKAHVSGKKSIISPFVLLGYSGDPALQLQCAKGYLQDRIPILPQPLWKGSIFHHDKIRIAYVSADFRHHPVAYLSAELFELHDRKRFEVIGASLGRDDHSEIRSRLVKAFDEFHDVRLASDRDAAKLLNDRRVDIAVDLTGYTRDSRPGIFAHRPAPIQVNYLGFPATMGAEFIDYIIADEMVLPVEQHPFYTEKVVYLPDWQVNDRKRKIAERMPTRREMGLSEHAFVFCCFNNHWKITPAIFDVWMRLLHQVEGSVLWLSQANNAAVHNLRREADARGINPSRLMFAPRLARLDDHLARHRLADLFLDTLPFNANTTASDALWAGLPVLTCKGEAFAGRVAASVARQSG